MRAPVADWAPLVMVTALPVVADVPVPTVVVLLLTVMVVLAVVPKAETPLANVCGAAVKAAVAAVEVVGLTATLALVLATMGSDPPPPQATSVAAATLSTKPPTIKRFLENMFQPFRKS